MLVVPKTEDGRGGFIFLHWLKTGGQFFAHNCRLNNLPAIDISIHGKRSAIPGEYKNLPRVGAVREPATWIASYFRHRWQHNNLWSPKHHPMDQCVARTADDFAKNVIDHHHGIMTNYDEGFTDGADFVIRFEHLLDDSESVLAEFGMELVTRELINATDASNPDDYLSAKVAHDFNCDNATYCDKYGYDLPGLVFEFSRFYSGWFRRSLRRWVAPRTRGRPIRMLEIGICEGGGAVAAFQEVLQHPLSEYVGHDNWVMGTERRANLNVPYEAKGRAWSFVGKDEINGSFDVIHIDGGHEHEDTKRDSWNCWPMLKPGGVMIFDDYGCEQYRSDHPGVKTAVDEFMGHPDIGSKIKPLSDGDYYQKVVMKIG